MRLWDVVTTTTSLVTSTAGAVLSGHTHKVYGMSFSPDGRYLATSSADQTVRIWDMAQPPPRTIAIMTGHTGRVTGVAYSPDGKFIASSSADNTVRRYLARFSDVWNLARQYVPRDLTADERLMLLGEKR